MHSRQMSEVLDRITKFVGYVATLKGDEKGEAQVFCDRLFQAFGHGGYKEAGATLEDRIKQSSGKGVSFADLVWKPRVLIEMKKRGEKLQKHYDQAFTYWMNAVPNRPRYVVLCNFDEFWIYDFDKQLIDPIDTVSIHDLADRYTTLNFLFPHDPRPHFGNDREAVSLVAADQMAELFRLLTRSARPKGTMGQTITRTQAQRFLLQLVVALFAEDIDLLPKDTIQTLVEDCLVNKQNSFDLFGGLFHQMNNPIPAVGGRLKGVRYFNGGLFSVIEPIELTPFELELLGSEGGAASKNWAKVNPTIFGALFQHSLDPKEQHKTGAHYTSEADIQRIIGPTILRPWRARIEAAETADALIAVRDELLKFRVLDPACGSGNFLYVAYRELARLDTRILVKLRDVMPEADFIAVLKAADGISPTQFFGIELEPFGAELTKVTLMLAKKLAMDEQHRSIELEGITTPFTIDALPLDNLDANIWNMDALFVEWPSVNAIVGNPPYQSKNKLQKEYGRVYVNQLRDRYPEIGGRADYCVYWIRRAHDHLQDGQRAGMVGTNTIRQNYSRESGLDYVVSTGGTITEAVSSMVWSGEANLHVSVVNWVKGMEVGPKRLYLQIGNDPDQGWSQINVDKIGASLSFALDVTKARSLSVNSARGGCFQGQTHGHDGFLLEADAAKAIIKGNPTYSAVLFPFLIGDDLIGELDAKPTRYVIDFQDHDLLGAQHYPLVYSRIQKLVLPDRQKAASEEEAQNEIAQAANGKARLNHHHSNFLKRWWHLSWERRELIGAIAPLTRYIVCGRVTKRPIFEFISTTIRPNDAVQVFPYDDDYSFGILQSGLHWVWFVERCSTLTERPRYTSNTVFDSFPWPQKPSAGAVATVAAAAAELRGIRSELRQKHKLSLRDLYRSIDADEAEVLPFLLELNLILAGSEEAGVPIQGPGLPEWIADRAPFLTADCVSP